MRPQTVTLHLEANIGTSVDHNWILQPNPGVIAYVSNLKFQINDENQENNFSKVFYDMIA